MQYAMAATSLAHTYGNITSFITEYVKGLFPRNYFNTIHISSSIAYKQFNIFQNTNKEFLKKRKPMLIIRPRIEIDEQDNFLFGTYLTQRITDNYMDLDFSNLQPFVEDDPKGIYIKFLLNRLKMYFDVSIIVESQMEQINQYATFKNRVRQGHNFFLSTALESFVPKELLKVLSDEVKIPMYDDNNSVKPFLDYINGKSYYPITYKLKNSTGKDEFFRYYPVNIDTLISGLTIDDGSKKGFVSDSFAVNFSLSTEFNAAGLYYYFTQTKEIIDAIEMSIMNDGQKIIPMFTVSNIFSQPLPDGWNLFTAPFYKVDTDDEPEIMDLTQVLNNSLLEVISYHKQKGIPMSTFMKVSLMKDNAMLSEENKDFVVDIPKLQVTINKVNTLSTYRLFIHVNTLYVNDLIKEVYEFKENK